MDESIRLAAYALYKRCDDAIKVNDFASAERLCEEAWQLIPEPKFCWDSSYMCLSHTVTLLRGARRYDRARLLVQEYLDSGFHLEYQDGPYFWLGTLYYEMGNLDEAFALFDRANRMSRGRCFKEEDPRYETFYKGLRSKGRPN
jgi:tetratricopeptide (TPR) repeat protein